MPHPRLLPPALLLAALSSSLAGQTLNERFAAMSRNAEERGLAEPFVGITTDGTPTAGLFPVRADGIDTAPIATAATAFLDTLTDVQRAKTTFPVEDDEWRKWMNQHFYLRQGVGFLEMTGGQREAAFALMRTTLSAKGLQLTRDIMRLNHTLGELNNDNFTEYGEWLYWLTIMGEPSATEPWGWQLDGHHVIINAFIQGDQMVMTPLFVGSEPVIATTGKYAGTAILQEEQNAGLAFMNGLPEQQRETATLDTAKPGNNNLTEAFHDNVVIDYAGLRADALSAEDRAALLALIQLYVDHQRGDAAKVKMQDVAAHLDETWFAWVGGNGADDAFYYRIHSPVILIEFDHQQPVGIRHLLDSRAPTRQHIHVVVRTPNGNDYGKDLLRQHLADHPHPH